MDRLITSFSEVGFYVSVEVWTFVIQHGASPWRMEAATRQGHPPPHYCPPTPSWSQTVPVVLCQLSLALGLISVNHSPALGSSFAPLTAAAATAAAAAAAAAQWQNVFSPLRLIELKVLHIHCCCFWTAASSEESISVRVFALHHRALTGHSAFRAEQKGLMGLVLSDATPAQSGSPSPPSASYGGKQ